MDKNAEIQRDRKGNIIYDKETKDTELVKWEESIEDYMAREVLPHIPDAAAFFEEDLGKKKPVIKTGAEIPFTRYFTNIRHQRQVKNWKQGLWNWSFQFRSVWQSCLSKVVLI